MTERVISELRLPSDHPVFAGHFPGRPMVPGVMLLDWALREVGAEIGRAGGGTLRLRESKFFDPLLPDQLAELAVAIDEDRCTFRIRRDDVVLAMGVLERRHD